jgi:hypothetical protein
LNFIDFSMKFHDLITWRRIYNNFIFNCFVVLSLHFNKLRTNHKISIHVSNFDIKRLRFSKSTKFLFWKTYLITFFWDLSIKMIKLWRLKIVFTPNIRRIVKYLLQNIGTFKTFFIVRLKVFEKIVFKFLKWRRRVFFRIKTFLIIMSIFRVFLSLWSWFILLFFKLIDIFRI